MQARASVAAATSSAHVRTTACDTDRSRIDVALTICMCCYLGIDMRATTKCARECVGIKTTASNITTSITRDDTGVSHLTHVFAPTVGVRSYPRATIDS